MEKQDTVVTRTRRKVIITRVEIDSQERCKKIEIRLPANVVRITGLLALAVLKDLPMP